MIQFKLNNAYEDFEIPQVSREIASGYEDVYIEKTMLSKSVKRRYFGRRFYASFSFAYLSAAQVATLKAILSAQRSTGYTMVKVSTIMGDNASTTDTTKIFDGKAIIELDRSQTRFSRDSSGNETWINFKINIKGAEVV